MGAPLLGKHFAELQGASTRTVAVAAAGSFLGQIAAVVQGAPLWLFVVAAVAPWVPILLLELVWTYRHYRWLAVFCVLLVSQSAYLLDQVARMVQLHVLGRDIGDSPGIFGVLGLERVQLIWSVWALLGLLVLVSRFPRNVWLWASLIASGAIAVEHVLTFSISQTRVDLEFGLSLVETALINIAFAFQLGRTYDAWLARAFPQLPERVLIDASNRLEELRLYAGERIAHEAEQVYIVTRGRGTLMRRGPGGHDILLGVLSPGQIVSEGGTLQADTTLELLALPASAMT